MASINSNKYNMIKKLYYKDKLSMKSVAVELGVGIDAITYFMRKYKMERRTPAQTNNYIFENKELSFTEQKKLSKNQENLKLAGLLLYWSEGYKSSKSSGIDFVNSDPEMIFVFINFLRKIYKVDEKRLRILLYCYTDQNIPKLIDFWSKLTKIPKSQFSKPYIRTDFRKDGRKMEFGMIHIRYADKKLFSCIMGSIAEMKKNMRRW